MQTPYLQTNTIKVLRMTSAGGSQGRVGAIVNTVDGTASAGADYKPVVDLEVIWEDGDTSDRAIPIKIYDDSFLEEDESFYVCITDVVPGLDAPFAIGLVSPANISPSSYCYTLHSIVTRRFLR